MSEVYRMDSKKEVTFNLNKGIVDVDTHGVGGAGRGAWRGGGGRMK
jgi:hypothetical protein